MDIPFGGYPMSFFWNQSKKNKKPSPDQNENSDLRKSGNIPLYSDLNSNLDKIKSELGNSSDLIIRHFELGSFQAKAAAVYVDTLTDNKLVDEFIMRSLMINTAQESLENIAADKSIFDFIKDNAKTIREVQVVTSWNELIMSVFSGDTVIFIDGWAQGISGSTRGGEFRAVTEPSSQVVIRGPKDGFTESIGTNISLVRRRIKSPNLWLEHMKIGDVSQTDIGIMYIKGIVNDKLVEEVKDRLQAIEIDAILESGYIEDLIQDETFTPFPTMFNTERPDSVAGNLLEGRVAIFVDGTPFVLVAPTTFFLYFQSVEDYYQRFDIGLAIRLLRYLAFFISLLGPSIYIAAITFHQEMIPTALLISLAAQRDGVPFPALVEAVMMEVTFEILREAGVRMPRAIGQAVSIVGALVLGQAAVQAGIISAAMVIVVAITGIASFAVPVFNLAISVRLLRFLIMVFAATAGFYGVAIIMIMIIAHLCSLRSFGVPYMAPMAPFILSDQDDAILHFPLWARLTRPRISGKKNNKRMKNHLAPTPGPEEK
jgi:spore germination protein KA